SSGRIDADDGLLLRHRHQRQAQDRENHSSHQGANSSTSPLRSKRSARFLGGGGNFLTRASTSVTESSSGPLCDWPMIFASSTLPSLAMKLRPRVARFFPCTTFGMFHCSLYAL